MHMHGSRQGKATPLATQGIVVTVAAWHYDLLVRWFVMRGKEQAFRRKTADLAQLQPSETVLDVGCGTGTLALIAKERVGATGHVAGIDPSMQLLAGARRKAARRGLTIDFQLGGIEQLPFPDQSFDVVLSTFVMHHLPDDLKRQGLQEITRVLKPGGRMLVVDFSHQEASQPDRAGAVMHDQVARMQEAGLAHIETGEMPFSLRSLGGRKAGHQHYGYVRAEKAS